jgi:anti-sigma B factor antagonist
LSALPPITDISVERHPGAVLVRITGELDLAAKPQFEECLKGLSNEKSAELVLDLREVTFIDSTGLRMVLDLWEHSRENGFDLAILPASQTVQRAFELTGLDGALPIVDRALPLDGKASSQPV